VTHRSRPPDRGSATVLMITLCFVFLAGALLWLSRTVDQSLDDRTNAAAIALQAARAGAQAIDPVSLREGRAVVDPAAAARTATSAAQQLLAANGDTGEVGGVSVEGNRVTVSVTITTTGRPATGSASASAVVGVDAPSP